MSMIGETEHEHLHCIYFYYLQYVQEEQEQQPRLQVTLYYYFDEDTPIRDRQDLRRLIRKLGENARAGDFSPPPCAYDFSTVPWRRKSYVVLLMNDQDHKFVNERSFNIEYRNPSHVEEYNHSFFNAQKFDIDLSGNGSGYMVTAVCCANLMQRKDGGNLEEDETELYDVILSPRDAPVMRFRDDDGPINQGGPIPPPGFL